ncbi:MAG: hypothetical protein GY859_34385, partial [Desulfobacterales bacterium]|nr:hypothetical protein [Desulfobacterales bacterium]
DNGFGLPGENLLNLFDTDNGPNGVDKKISEFLDKRIKRGGDPGDRVENLLFYYIGHGGFVDSHKDLYLAIKTTRMRNPDVSAVRIKSLAKTIKESARWLRRFIILDCCFAAAAFSSFQSPGATVVRKQTLDAFKESPKRGVALLCSSAAGLPSVIPEGAGHTMFSGALLHALGRGDAAHGATLSLEEVHQLVENRLFEEYGDEAVRPEIHCPYQRDGDLTRVPLFPNPGQRLASPGEAVGGEMVNEKNFLDDLFERSRTFRVVLLFAQAGREHPGVHHGLMSRAGDLFGPENILRVTPPHAPDLDLADYFSMLGAQCGADREIKTALEFEMLIGDKLRKAGRLFLLVYLFEQGNEKGRKELAASLRALSEPHGSKLNILICGGGKMAEMYYCGGPFSLLNNAEVMSWPEIGVEDVRLLHPRKPLSRDAARELLEISGGHPRLLRKALEYYTPGKPFDASACFEALTRFPPVWRFFIHYKKNNPAKDCRRLLEKLAGEDVGPYEPYIYNPLVRRLYWQNLLKRSPDGSRLIWRCQAIREAGKRILGEAHNG